MKSTQPTDHSRRLATLWLVTVLHAFTHIYTIALVPLYLAIRRDLHLMSDSQATLLVTIQSLVYCGASLPLGILADKLSRKRLLWIGLFLNALAFGALAFAPGYHWTLLAVALAGLFGSFYHPPATALIVSLFPDRPGWALGRAGIGAALGFFVGPLYAGWRAETAGWRQPCLELAIAGAVVAVLFALFAHEPHDAPHRLVRDDAHRTRRQWRLLLGVGVVAVAFGFRDFAGAGMVTFSSLFLQRAHGFGANSTGLFIGLWSLVGVLSNPLVGSMSDKRRTPAIIAILACAAISASAIPWLPRAWVWLGLVVYGFFILASFPVVEAALMEGVHDSLRGRTFGMFITVAGVIASLAHWAMGRAADSLHQRATEPLAYTGWFAMLGVLLVLGLSGIPALRWSRKPKRT
jgi:predicted MFS family arabinose efflux permease